MHDVVRSETSKRRMADDFRTTIFDEALWPAVARFSCVVSAHHFTTQTGCDRDFLYFEYSNYII